MTKLSSDPKPAKKSGKLARENYSSLLAWESAVSAVYGGIQKDWPEWAKKVLKDERGYI